MTEYEIFNDIVGNNKLDQETIELMVNGSKGEGLDYHFMNVELCRWIRNAYGLWSKKNSNVILNPLPNAEGIIDHPSFPDNLSGRIFDRLVTYYKCVSEIRDKTPIV